MKLRSKENGSGEEGHVIVHRGSGSGMLTRQTETIFLRIKSALFQLNNKSSLPVIYWLIRGSLVREISPNNIYSTFKLNVFKNYDKNKKLAMLKSLYLASKNNFSKEGKNHGQL